MSAIDSLISYIKNLKPEQVAEAKESIYAWLSKRPEAKQHPLQKEYEQAQ